jgi:hypothetical protein
VNRRHGRARKPNQRGATQNKLFLILSPSAGDRQFSESGAPASGPTARPEDETGRFMKIQAIEIVVFYFKILDMHTDTNEVPR